MERITSFLRQYKWRILATAIGITGGYLYWYYIGCSSGTCPIQSNWHTSSLYGGLLGYLFSDFKKEKKQTNQDGNIQ